MSAEQPIPQDIAGQLGWLVAMAAGQAENLKDVKEELRRDREERRIDLRELRVWLVEEFERIENKVADVEQRTKLLEDAQNTARGFLGGLKAVWAFVLALPAGVIAGFFGGQQVN